MNRPKWLFSACLYGCGRAALTVLHGSKPILAECLNDTQRDRVHPDTALHILDRERFGGGRRGGSQKISPSGRASAAAVARIFTYIPIAYNKFCESEAI
jgi:hypothetical protein